MIPNIEHFPYLGLFLLLLFGGVGLPFPEDATLILCGFLISTQIVKPIPALIIVYAGLLIADLTLHFIGKKYGRQVVTHRRFHKLISPERLSFLEDKFNRRGILIILLGRHVAGLRAQLFLVSGIMEMPTLKFLMTDAVSSLLTMALMIGAGYWGGNSLKFLKQGLVRIEHIAILVVIIFILFYSIYRYLKPKLINKS
ncbi:MAG: DedA family protein [Deltaproteobacteria bacterium]|nr:DedA family protein [Deltaproteobacteria bacterium]